MHLPRARVFCTADTSYRSERGNFVVRRLFYHAGEMTRRECLSEVENFLLGAYEHATWDGAEVEDPARDALWPG